MTFVLSHIYYYWVVYQLQVKSSNEEYVIHDIRFTKSSTKEKYNNIGFNYQTEICEDVANDEVERNDIPMDVNIGMEAFGDL